MAKVPNNGNTVKTGTNLVVQLKPGAMSTEVGAAVLKMLDQQWDVTQQIEAAEKDRGARSRRMLAMLASGLVKAYRADTSIPLHELMGDDKAKKIKANEILEFALGVQVPVTAKDGTQKLDYAPGFAEFMNAKEDADARTKNRRTNFRHTWRKAAEAAIYIIDNKVEVKYVDETLMLTGPRVQKDFGTPTVLLDEKDKGAPVYDKRGTATADKVNLLAKPSFNAISERARAEHGKAPHRAQPNVAPASVSADPEAHLEALCKALVAALEKIEGELTERQTRAVDSVYSAIDNLR